MKSFSVEIKVGLFALVVLLLFSYMTFKVGKIDWFKKKGYTVYLSFTNLAGIDKKSKVKVAGVDAGLIEEVDLEDSKVRVTVRMSEKTKLYSDAVATVKFTGLLGDKFLEIRPGSRMPLLKDGDEVANVVEPMDMNALLQNLSVVSGEITKFTSSLHEALGPRESEQLKETIQNLREVSRNLNAAIVSNDRKLKMMIENIDGLTTSLRETLGTNSEPLTATVTNLRDFSGVLRTDGQSLLKNLNEVTTDLKAVVDENRPALRSTLENLDKTMKRIEGGEGTLGKLVNDDRLYESMNRAAEGVDKTINALDRFRIFLTLQGEYLTNPEKGKGYATITLQPNPRSSLILGVVSDPVGSVTTTDSGVSRSRKTEFTAQYARRFVESGTFRDTAVRGGLTENTLGFGIDQFFANDRFKASLDAWNFDPDDADAKNPHLRIGANYFVFRHIFISGGMDDLLNRKTRGGFFGGGVRFGN